ncbi:MAG: PQQ-binding-like beta-propeller repeat protein [Verrucomicrobiales bacterium]|nr:PQQ-binding-like beta-propeller repeat protein [Verrucomicrobiales bacterium]
MGSFCGLFAAISAVGGEHDWPQFRGASASGIAPDGQDLPERWNVETGEGILYRVEIPGLAHSSPISWGDRIFLTTAVNTAGDSSFKPGLYGSGDAASDRRNDHEFRILCLEKSTGKTVWEKTAVTAKPIDKRHVKATYANSTPVTDGKHVVAFFGSQGLFAYSIEGEFLWKKDLGRLDVGAYDLPSYEWGGASSPIIWDGLVIVQCDSQGESFIAAFDVETGDEKWLTKRNELPSWGTPTVFPGGNRAELITNGSNFIRGYDPATGKELWRLGGSSKITAPTPFFAENRIVVCSGRAPERPIFVIKPGGTGELGLEDLAWSVNRRGPYMPTPIIVEGKLFVLNNSGPFACYDLHTGLEHFYLRLPHAGDGFSASPVAADGKIYFSGEAGNVFVVEAATRFNLLATNPLGEPLMASPVISEGVIYFRGAKHLFAVGSK